MGKHYNISGNEIKILNGHLRNYLNYPNKSTERSAIVNKAIQDLYNSGYTRWNHKHVIVYFNNNKKIFDESPQTQPPSIQLNNPLNTFKVTQESLTQIPPLINKGNLSQIKTSQSFIPIALQQISPLHLTNERDFNTGPANKLYPSPKDNSFSKSEYTDNDSIELIGTPIDDTILTSNDFEFETRKDESEPSTPTIQSTKIKDTDNDNDDDPIEKCLFKYKKTETKTETEIEIKKKGEDIISTDNFKTQEKIILRTKSINDNEDSQSDFSCQSSSISSSSSSINFQYEFYAKTPELKDLNDLLKQLPPIPAYTDQNISTSEYDRLKYDLNQLIQMSYRFLHQMVEYCNKNYPDLQVFNEERLNFLNKLEKPWNKILNNLFTLTQKSLHSYDPKIPRVSGPKFFRKISKTTRRYNNEEVSASVSRNNSTNEIKPIESTSQPASPEKEALIKKYLKDLHIIPYKDLSNPNPKLDNLYKGIVNRENYDFFEDEESLSTTIVTYHLTKKIDGGENEDILIFEIANVHKINETNMVLIFKEHEIEFKSFAYVSTIYFYRHESSDTVINKFYVSGNKCIKEFTIFGLDEYFISDDEKADFEIIETNKFSFGTDNINVKYEAIKVWDNELVAGFGSTVFFWKIDNRTTTGPIKSKRCSNQIKIDTMKEISSIAIIEYSQNESFLAVASSDNPVIYIYDKNHKNVLKLISHTMGVRSLKTVGNKLFSGSLDLHVRLWNLKDAIPITDYNTQLKIITFEIGFFLGQCFLFVAGKKYIQCFNITNGEFLFYMCFHTFIPKQMFFLTGKNEESGDFARLVIISDKVNEDNQTKSNLIITIEFL